MRFRYKSSRIGYILSSPKLGSTSISGKVKKEIAGVGIYCQCWCQDTNAGNKALCTCDGSNLNPDKTPICTNPYCNCND